MKILTSSFIICLIVIIQSCSPILGLYGVRNPKEISEKKIINYSKRLAIPKDAIYQLDTSYFSFLASLKMKLNDSMITDTLKKKELKKLVQNHYQPLQALYFNKKKKLGIISDQLLRWWFSKLKLGKRWYFNYFPTKNSGAS